MPDSTPTWGPRTWAALAAAVAVAVLVAAFGEKVVSLSQQRAVEAAQQRERDELRRLVEEARRTAPAGRGTGAPDAGGGREGSSMGGPGADGAGGGMPVARADAELLVGMGEGEARDAAESRGWALRVSSRDGQPYSLTQDYDPRRVNVALDGGTVRAVTVG